MHDSHRACGMTPDATPLVQITSAANYQSNSSITVTSLPQSPLLGPHLAIFYLVLCGQQGRLEENRRGKGRDERQGHQLAHAGGARVMRKPKAAECGSRRAGAEQNGARQTRLQEVDVARAPRHDVVDFEGDADAQKKRQRDYVCKIQLQPDHDTDLECNDDGDEQRHQRQRNVGPAT